VGPPIGIFRPLGQDGPGILIGKTKGCPARRKFEPSYSSPLYLKMPYLKMPIKKGLDSCLFMLLIENGFPDRFTKPHEVTRFVSSLRVYLPVA